MTHGLGYRHDLNDFAWLKRNQVRFVGSAFASLSIPNEIDPRAGQWVKDQGQTSQCHGYSGSSIEERVHFVATGERARFSGHFKAMVNEIADGAQPPLRDTGGSIVGSLKAAMSEGICDETDCPSDGPDGNATFGDGTIPQTALQIGLKRLIRSGTSDLSNSDAVRQYLGTTGGGVQLGFIVGPRFMKLKSPLTASIIQADEADVQRYGEQAGGGHALAGLGYDKDGNFWGLNSWDVGFDEGGWFVITPDGMDYICHGGMMGDKCVVGMAKMDDYEDPAAAINWDKWKF